jgi:tetratricopeptide (TPR) repeat protein
MVGGKRTNRKSLLCGCFFIPFTIFGCPILAQQGGNRIRASVDAMQAVSGMTKPLLETRVVPMRSGLAFRLSGAMVDPIARQFIFDFDSQNPARLAEMGDYPGNQAAREARIASLFMAAVGHEERGSADDAIPLYEEILALHQSHPPACINLGTICYNKCEFLRAESLYRRATVADPNYALASLICFFANASAVGQSGETKRS